MSFISRIKEKADECFKKCYVVHKDDVGNYYICRVLNSYENEDEAISDLCNLLGHKITERDLLKVFTDKEEL